LEREIISLFKWKEDKKFQIRYQDEEEDWITISSDMELSFALQLFSQKIMKLSVLIQEDRREIFLKPIIPTPLNPANNNNYNKWQERNYYGYPKSEKGPKLGKMAARFIKHVTYDDDCILPPNAKFLKTWKFRNDGDIPWPSNCLLLFVGKKKRRSDEWT